MPEFELVIRGGRVIDPASGVDAVMDLAVKAGKIAALSTSTLVGRRVVDASGLVVAPGFIDIHSHVDGIPHAGHCNARMGVTTVVAGNCGTTVAPEGLDVAAFLDRVDGNFPVNTAFLTGASDIRKAAGVDPGKPASDEDIGRMLKLAQRALDGGAIGLSFGIEYSPGTSLKELKAFGNLARDRDIPCPVHIRSGGPFVPFLKSGAPAAIREVLDAARTTQARFHISHIGGQIGIRTRPREALLQEGLRLVEEARAEGLDIESDMHPYDAGGTWIDAALLDIFEMGFPVPQVIKSSVFLDIGMIEVGTGPHAGERLTRPLLRQIRKKDPRTLVVLHFFDRDLIEQVLLRKWVSFISDGDFDPVTGSPSHPRCSGTFPRFIQWLVRERKVMSLSEALERMTIMPARRFGLEKKGRLSLGSDADIVIFDFATMADNASYREPDTAPSGIRHVFVNGTAVLDGGVMTDLKPGRALRF